MVSPELYHLKIAALLHDVGKPICWAKREEWTRHVYHTYDIVKEVFGEEIALTAMRHHSSRYYSSNVHPKTEFEKIICLSDSMASAADRPEEAYKRSPRPRLPIELSHPLTDGEPRKKCSCDSLLKVHEGVLSLLKTVYDRCNGDIKAVYAEVYKSFSEPTSLMNEVPAHTSPPINDHSLFDHAKLTTAIATCMYLSGGYRGNDVERYRFALLSGDVDRIQAFINMSRRLPDLIGGSRLVNCALHKATSVIGELLGFDCIIYEGGGGFLALVPPRMSKDFEEKVRDAFIEESGGGLTITVSTVEVDGSELKNFGSVWEKAIRKMRHLKAKRVGRYFEPIEPPNIPCDECGVRVATHKDGTYLLSLNAEVKPDLLCETCWRRRMLGRGETKIQVDNIAAKDERGFIAVLKMDGDRIGEVLNGTRIREELGKAMTPSRLSAVSRLLHESSQALSCIVEEHGGKCVYAGGDDLLAILPGFEGLKVACIIADEFKKKLAAFTSMSAGVVLVKGKHPLQVALEVARALLDRAKEAGRNRIDYRVIVGTGYSSRDIHMDEDKFPRRPYEWETFKCVLRYARELGTYGLALSQLRALMSSARDPKKAEFFLKSQTGRGVIAYEAYERLFRLLKDNLFSDVYEIFMLSGVESRVSYR